MNSRRRVNSDVRREETLVVHGQPTTVDPWSQIEADTGWTIPASARQGCEAPKLVTIPAGRELYASGPSTKVRMEWGAFEENDIGWYLQGNQLDPSWYLDTRTQRIPMYEYVVTLETPTLAVMSKVAAQSGAPLRAEPSKFQYYTPVGLGTPKRVRLLGHLEVDGSFIPATDAD
ncbi:MAG TPA: hypothetical protein VN643_17715 [Pyrinomonadaceae bacterium]|nr:hypothetical protein [Pyrinomonadaceae bacterium]